MRSETNKMPAAGSLLSPRSRHNCALRIIALGLNRFAVGVRGKARSASCHALCLDS
jgi:hypothetical protein